MKNENTATAPAAKTYQLPARVFAGTMIEGADGKIILSAHEEGENCGGNFDSIRDWLKDANTALNEHAALVAVAEAACEHCGCGECTLCLALANLAAVREQ